jgi:hypothetical protein
MFPPSANTHTAQEISTFPGYHDDINNDNNTTKPEDNTFAQTHDEDEDEEKGSP